MDREHGRLAVYWVLRCLGRMDAVVYPRRGGVGGESGHNPLGGQRHRTDPGVGGIVSYGVRQSDQLSVSAHVAKAAPIVSTGAGRRNR